MTLSFVRRQRFWSAAHSKMPDRASSAHTDTTMLHPYFSTIEPNVIMEAEQPRYVTEKLKAAKVYIFP